MSHVVDFDLQGSQLRRGWQGWILNHSVVLLFWRSQNVPGGDGELHGGGSRVTQDSPHPGTINASCAPPSSPSQTLRGPEETLTAAEVMAPAGNKKVKRRNSGGFGFIISFDSVCTLLKRAGHFGASGCRGDRYRRRGLRICSWEERLRKSWAVDTWGHHGVPRRR